MREAIDDSWMQPSNQHTGDETLNVKFELVAMQDEAESAKQGRPIFKDLEFIKIASGGQKLSIIHRPIREEDKRRFPRHYDAFKRGMEAPIVGTPLAEWPGITRGQVEELAHFHVRSVEQLAEMSDANAQNFAGMQALKARARDFLEKAKGNAPLEKMRAELSTRDNQIEALTRQLKEQGELLEKLAKKSSRRADNDETQAK